MKVIIDTDPGIDDAMALLFAHYANDIELLGITTVFGNGTIDTVTQNTLTICEQFQINAPVHQGAGAPLQVAVDPPPAFVHGNDGLGDIDAPKPKGAARNQSAANFIVETILKHPNEITVIGIGRLTNLAIALQQHPAIAQLVKKVVIMGGALGSNAHTGNVTPVAEANIYGDPHAADQVLTAPWPVTLVGLDVTMQCIMHRPQLQKICSAAGAAGRFMWAISRHFESFLFCISRRQWLPHARHLRHRLCARTAFIYNPIRGHTSRYSGHQPRPNHNGFARQKISSRRMDGRPNSTRVHRYRCRCCFESISASAHQTLTLLQIHDAKSNASACLPSKQSNARLLSIPPANPTKAPLLPITR